ncbi:MAG: hypothetical protein ACRC5T_03720 [Cetobacterium sp.]
MADIIDISDYDLPEEALNLRNLLAGVLERLEAIYTSYNVPLPERRYWTMGQPATDCEQLVVYFVQMYLGAPGDEAVAPMRCNSPRSAVLSVQISRPIPVVGQSGKAPAASKIQDGSEILAVDAWILMESINLLDQWEEGSYGPGVIATVNVLEPQGGFQTANLQITLAVP